MAENNTPETEDFELPAEIRAAFAAYPRPKTSPSFQTRFWAALETRQRRYRGFTGLIRRLWEVEVEGVAVWRLVASTLTGGGVCLVLAGLAFASSSPQSTQTSVPRPVNSEVAISAYACYRRDWEIDLLAPEIQSPLRPLPKVTPAKEFKKAGEYSWKDSNAFLA